MEMLSAVDSLFLWLERRRQPLHVAGLQIFRFPEDAEPDYVNKLAESMRQYNSPTPPFNQRIVSRWGLGHWDQDKRFDLDHHFRHVALPRPGGPKELVTFISAEHSNLLDRFRPLWETYLIEAMHGRHFAIYTKVHHSLMDGVSAVRLGMRMLSNDPAQRDMPPMWQMPLRESSRHADNNYGFLAQLGSLTKLAKTQMQTVPVVAGALYDAMQKARKNPELTHIFSAPRCRLTQSITGSRRFAAKSFDASRLKAVATRLNATTNDVILAMCGGALRTYLKYQNELPDKPLIAMVPMSLRTDDSIGGNQVATLLANMGTHIEGTLERFEVVRQSVLDAKQRFSGMTPEQILNYTALMLAPTGFSLLTGLMPQWLAFNLVISNVPGPHETCYWNGAQLEHMFPVSAIVNHMALNITLISYDGKLDFGVVGCRRTLPSIQRLLNHMEQELEELERAVGLQQSPATPPKKRKKKVATQS